MRYISIDKPIDIGVGGEHIALWLDGEHIAVISHDLARDMCERVLRVLLLLDQQTMPEIPDTLVANEEVEVKPDERGIGYYKAQAAYYMSLAERLQRKVDAATFLPYQAQETHNTMKGDEADDGGFIDTQGA